MNIIQTWKTKNIPSHYESLVKKISEINPDWNYMLFDDLDIVDFIKSKMPQYYFTFLNLTSKIQQIDFFRYLAIYYYGGVYIDLDIDLVKNFDDFKYMDYYCVFPIEVKNAGDEILKSTGSPLIGNYAFYAPKGHSFLKRIINNIVSQRIPNEIIEKAQKNHSDDPRDVYVYYRTGPLLVSQTYIDYINDNQKDIILTESLPYEDNRFGNYGYHRCYGSWRHIISDQTPI